MKFKMIAFFLIAVFLLICVCGVPVNEVNVSVKANETEVRGTFTGMLSPLKGKNGIFTAEDGWTFEGIINADGGLWEGQLTDFPFSEAARDSSVFELPAYYTGAVKESALVDLTLKPQKHDSVVATYLRDVFVNSPELQLSLVTGVDPRQMEFDSAYGGLDCAVNAEHFLDYNLKLMSWEKTEREFEAYEQPCTGVIFCGTDWYLSAYEDDPYIWFECLEESGWYLPKRENQVEDVYYMLRSWYDEVEYHALEQTISVSDKGQSALEAAEEYIRKQSDLHLQVGQGSKYRYTYVSTIVSIDELAEQTTQQLRERHEIDENSYCFSVKTIFVPENEAALMWGMAGNTVPYDGNHPKVPEGGFQEWNCGIIARENGAWVLTHLGTSW